MSLQMIKAQFFDLTVILFRGQHSPLPPLLYDWGTNSTFRYYHYSTLGLSFQ